MRHRSSQLRAVRLVRSGQPARMHAVDPGAGNAEKHAQYVLALRPADHRRARNDDAQSRYRPQGVRRSVQVLVALLSDSDRETVRRQLADITHSVTLLVFTQTF